MVGTAASVPWLPCAYGLTRQVSRGGVLWTRWDRAAPSSDCSPSASIFRRPLARIDNTAKSLAVTLNSLIRPSWSVYATVLLKSSTPCRSKNTVHTLCYCPTTHIVSEFLRCRITCKSLQPGQLRAPPCCALERQNSRIRVMAFRRGSAASEQRARRRSCLRSVAMVGEEPLGHRGSERGDVDDDLWERSGRGIQNHGSR